MAMPRGARQRADAIRALLQAEYPEVQCALHHRNAYELLAATILSAQCTDERVNQVTPGLFARYPAPSDLASADPEAVETLIRSTGFYRAKAKSLIGMAQALEDRFGGTVPTELEDLTTIPGVGRKTGNVVRSVVFGLPGLPVDTHVGRLALRLRLTSERDPVKVEHELNALVPDDERGGFSLRLIEHGRRVCDARAPKCAECVLAGVCPSAGDGKALQATRKKPAAGTTRRSTRAKTTTTSTRSVTNEKAPNEKAPKRKSRRRD
ncbi:MAG: endonuclease III [Acidimicrobiia bacterium]